MDPVLLPFSDLPFSDLPDMAPALDVWFGTVDRPAGWTSAIPLHTPAGLAFGSYWLGLRTGMDVRDVLPMWGWSGGEASLPGLAGMQMKVGVNLRRYKLVGANGIVVFRQPGEPAGNSSPLLGVHDIEGIGYVGKAEAMRRACLAITRR